MTTSELHEDNRAAWDITADIYERDEARDFALLRAGGNTFLEAELRFLRDLAPAAKRAVHLQCAGGSDTLSLWRLGCPEVIGIDIAPRMIAVAKRKSEALGAPASWHCCDVLETPHDLDGTVDLVHTGRGAICWMMDLDAWATLVNRLLAPGGTFHLFEGHPLDGVWDYNASSFELNASGDYFASGPGGGDVWPRPLIEDQPQERKAGIRLHDRCWPLGKVATSLASTGLRLVHLEEYPEQFWNHFKNIPSELARRLPHTYTLIMTKE